MVTAAVLNAFCNDSGQFGNPVAVILDIEENFDNARRQLIAKATGFSETVFVNALSPTPQIRFFTPQQEIPFAGHAAVGAARYIEDEHGIKVTELGILGGTIRAYSEEGATWVRSDLRSTPPWLYERLSDVAELNALDGPQDPTQGYTLLWAWMDEAQSIARARTFAPDWGIPEDEANGSGCMRLAAALGRPVTFHHGRGSIVLARPAGPGYGEVGGLAIRMSDLDVNQ